MKRKHLYIIISFIITLSIFNSFLSSSHPDGLERVAENHHFTELAQNSISLFKDYNLPIGSGFIGSSLAGILGVILTTVILSGLGKALASKK